MSPNVDIVKCDFEAPWHLGELAPVSPSRPEIMNEVSELIDALELLFRGIASEAVAIALEHSEMPLAKCILFLAYDFFFLEPAKAAAVFGGTDGLRERLAPGRVEGYFVQGYRALFCREHDAALPEFNAGLRVAPGDPFLLFGIAVAQWRRGDSTAAAKAIFKIEEVAPLHPLVSLFRKMLRNQADY